VLEMKGESRHDNQQQQRQRQRTRAQEHGSWLHLAQRQPSQQW
jgi:hypothetical protein